MDILRIVPNISSGKMEESKKFYEDFLGLSLVMDMEWIMTFTSVVNPAAQICIIKNDKPNIFTSYIKKLFHWIIK
jgi:predicted enzyme related to lactoylglutathione lyase